MLLGAMKPEAEEEPEAPKTPEERYDEAKTPTARLAILRESGYSGSWRDVKSVKFEKDGSIAIETHSGFRVRLDHNDAGETKINIAKITDSPDKFVEYNAAGRPIGRWQMKSGDSVTVTKNGYQDLNATHGPIFYQGTRNMTPARRGGKGDGDTRDPGAMHGNIGELVVRGRNAKVDVVFGNKIVDGENKVVPLRMVDNRSGAVLGERKEDGSWKDFKPTLKTEGGRLIDSFKNVTARFDQGTGQVMMSGDVELRAGERLAGELGGRGKSGDGGEDVRMASNVDMELNAKKPSQFTYVGKAGGGTAPVAMNGGKTTVVAANYFENSDIVKVDGRSREVLATYGDGDKLPGTDQKFSVPDIQDAGKSTAGKKMLDQVGVREGQSVILNKAGQQVGSLLQRVGKPTEVTYSPSVAGVAAAKQFFVAQVDKFEPGKALATYNVGMAGVGARVTFNTKMDTSDKLGAIATTLAKMPVTRVALNTTEAQLQKLGKTAFEGHAGVESYVINAKTVDSRGTADVSISNDRKSGVFGATLRVQTNSHELATQLFGEPAVQKSETNLTNRLSSAGITVPVAERLNYGRQNNDIIVTRNWTAPSGQECSMSSLTDRTHLNLTPRFSFNEAAAKLIHGDAPVAAGKTGAQADLTVARMASVAAPAVQKGATEFGFTESNGKLSVSAQGTFELNTHTYNVQTAVTQSAAGSVHFEKSASATIEDVKTGVVIQLGAKGTLANADAMHETIRTAGPSLEAKIVAVRALDTEANRNAGLLGISGVRSGDRTMQASYQVAGHVDGFVTDSVTKKTVRIDLGGTADTAKQAAGVAESALTTLAPAQTRVAFNNAVGKLNTADNHAAGLRGAIAIVEGVHLQAGFPSGASPVVIQTHLSNGAQFVYSLSNPSHLVSAQTLTARAAENLGSMKAAILEVLNKSGDKTALAQFAQSWANVESGKKEIGELNMGMDGGISAAVSIHVGAGAQINIAAVGLMEKPQLSFDAAALKTAVGDKTFSTLQTAAQGGLFAQLKTDGKITNATMSGAIFGGNEINVQWSATRNVPGGVGKEETVSVGIQKGIGTTLVSGVQFAELIKPGSSAAATAAETKVKSLPNVKSANAERVVMDISGKDIKISQVAVETKLQDEKGLFKEAVGVTIDSQTGKVSALSMTLRAGEAIGVAKIAEAKASVTLNVGLVNSVVQQVTIDDKGNLAFLSVQGTIPAGRSVTLTTMVDGATGKFSGLRLDNTIKPEEAKALGVKTDVETARNEAANKSGLAEPKTEALITNEKKEVVAATVSGKIPGVNGREVTLTVMMDGSTGKFAGLRLDNTITPEEAKALGVKTDVGTARNEAANKSGLAEPKTEALITNEKKEVVAATVSGQIPGGREVTLTVMMDATTGKFAGLRLDNMIKPEEAKALGVKTDVETARNEAADKSGLAEPKTEALITNEKKEVVAATVSGKIPGVNGRDVTLTTMVNGATGKFAGLRLDNTITPEEAKALGVKTDISGSRKDAEKNSGLVEAKTDALITNEKKEVVAATVSGKIPGGREVTLTVMMDATTGKFAGLRLDNTITPEEAKALGVKTDISGSRKDAEKNSGLVEAKTDALITNEKKEVVAATVSGKIPGGREVTLTVMMDATTGKFAGLRLDNTITPEEAKALGVKTDVGVAPHQHRSSLPTLSLPPA